jgi:hypothetical protein
VERKSFSDLLINATSLTPDEAEQLATLIRDFPYSQPIHNLAARAAQDNGLDIKENLLRISSIYSTDRNALKAIMTAPKQVRIEEEIAQPFVIEQSNNDNQDKSTDEIIDELMRTINSMHQSMEIFENTVEGIETKPIPSIIETKSAPTIENKPLSNLEGGSLIEEIKSTKKQIKLEGSKQIEQSEIIDRFIQTQPSITRKSNASSDEVHDFSEPDEQFGTNIVSETLVEILLKQGKKEKAIEVLKKLIWKFPQKKAYFAAQIEDLKK